MKNKKTLLIVGALSVLALGGFFYYKKKKNEGEGLMPRLSSDEMEALRKKPTYNPTKTSTKLDVMRKTIDSSKPIDMGERFKMDETIK